MSSSSSSSSSEASSAATEAVVLSAIPSSLGGDDRCGRNDARNLTPLKGRDETGRTTSSPSSSLPIPDRSHHLDGENEDRELASSFEKMKVGFIRTHDESKRHPNSKFTSSQYHHHFYDYDHLTADPSFHGKMSEDDASSSSVRNPSSSSPTTSSPTTSGLKNFSQILRKKRLLVKPSKLNVSLSSATSTISSVVASDDTSSLQDDASKIDTSTGKDHPSKANHRPTTKINEDLLKEVFGDRPLLQDFSTFCKRLDTISLKDDHLNSRRSSTIDFNSPSFTTMQRFHHPNNSNNSYSNGPKAKKAKKSTCAAQARQELDISVDDLAGYLEDSIVFPKKMSYMAEMMYT